MATWDDVKKKFDDAVAIGIFAAHEWTQVFSLHETPAAALKHIEAKAKELASRAPKAPEFKY